MKKIILSLVIVAYFISNLNAKSSSQGLVCSAKEVAPFFISPYVNTQAFSTNGAYPVILFDTRMVKIDRNKKTIELWTTWLASKYGRQRYMQVADGLDHFGYEQQLTVYDYRAMRSNLKRSVFHNCDGSAIDAIDYPDKWVVLSPDSVNFLIIKELIKKYQLN